MKEYNLKDLKDTYRISSKYWKTGDVDYLEGVNAIAQRIDEKYWIEVTNLVTFAVRKNYDVETVVSALELFGYKAEVER